MVWIYPTTGGLMSRSKVAKLGLRATNAALQKIARDHDSNGAQYARFGISR
jgi:hypothetical protein